MDDSFVEKALAAASHTRLLRVEPGVRHEAARYFRESFGDAPAVIVADPNTFGAAGRDVREEFDRAGISQAEPFLFGPDVYAEYSHFESLLAAVSAVPGIPVAVGSGTINDLTKLAAHRLGRPYMVVATAASMDGYTAYGASITHRGSKQTFDCPAPRAVLADLKVIARAPAGLNASGYADLLAKGVAGADWIVADEVGEEAIDAAAWSTVQERLPGWVSDPAGVREARPEYLRSLVTGLMMSGFAMQATRSSRPASGAEHQFSHLWDMQHHTHNGKAPSHGFKVGIGTLASLALYEVILGWDMERMDIESAVRAWPSLAQMESRILEIFGPGELAEKALLETRAKYIEPPALRNQLSRLRERWPGLRRRLAEHLGPFRDARAMLREAGAASEPSEIGISSARLRQSYEQAYFIRRRFTVLDLAMRLNLFEPALDAVFGDGPFTSHYQPGRSGPIGKL
jgi:glycerol-1-phosphate dehydrogenase [NAD(P)+]